jgi:hypothetical protein
VLEKVTAYRGDAAESEEEEPPAPSAGSPLSGLNTVDDETGEPEHPA